MLRAVHNQIAGMHIFPYDCYVPITYQDFGKGGGHKYIQNWGGGGGYGRRRSPSRDSKGVWGSADCSFSGVWGEASAAFLLLRLFSMKFTVISNTYT